MIQTLLLDVRQIPDCPECLFEKYHISDERRKKVRNYRFLKDKKLCTGAGVLLDIICNRADMKVEQREITYGKKGKPYFKNYEELSFNISHSGDYVVCAYGDAEVGIDIEKVDSRAGDGFWKEVLTAQENRYVFSATGEERAQRFYRIWTIKEAFVKTIGVGIHIPFQSFEIDFMPEIVISQQVNRKSYSFCEYNLQGYKITACTVLGQEMSAFYEDIRL